MALKMKGGVMKQKPINSNWTDEQWEAISIRNSNVLVSAGAGSGKTAVLSERVLELVREGVAVTDLIVLTFTNAAAAEMKERIRNKLIADGEVNSLSKLAAEKIDRSFITTFDSYCLYLVKKYNYMLNISQNISIIDNITASREKVEILTQVINSRISANDQLLISFIEDYSATSINEIITMLLAWYNQATQNMNDFTLTDSLQAFNQYEQLVLTKLERVKTLAAEIRSLAGETNLPEKIDERLAIVYTATNYDAIHQSIEMVFETRFWQVPRKEFPDKDYIKQLNDLLKKELKTLRSLTTMSQEQHIQLLTQNNQYKQLIEDVLNQFSNQFMAYKQQAGLFEFIDINLMAIKLLKQNPTICDTLRETVYEIMIDEYQDTNDIQEKFVSLICNNNVYMVGDIKQSIYGFRNANPSLFSSKFKAYSSKQGGTLITLTKNFRSRSSILEQVNNFFERVMSDNYGGIDYDQSQVMIYGNTSYDLLADTNTNEVIYYDSEEIEIDRSDFEIIQIFKDIQNKLKNAYQVVDNGTARTVKLSDFAIICATREKFERIVQIGEFYNISVKADIQEKFSASDEIAVIQSAFNILNVIKNNHDDDQKLIYSIVQLARSYLFNYTDHQIDIAVSKLNMIKANQVSKRMYSLECGELSELGAVIKEISFNIDLKSNHYILELIIEKLNIVANLHYLDNPLVRQMRITKILELISDFDTRNYSLENVCQVLNEIERNQDLDVEFSSNSELETDSVTVITTHKSKGLEYNICYFPFLFKKFNVMDLNSKTGYSHDYTYIFPSKLANGNLTQTIEKTIFNEQSKQQLISEKIRLFYVAITRAKDKNVLIIDQKGFADSKFNPIEKANTLNDFIFNGWDSLKQYQKMSSLLTADEVAASKYNQFGKKQQTNNSKLQMISYENLQVEAQSFEKRRASQTLVKVVSSEVANNINLGNQVHEYLEFCDLDNLEQEINKADGPLKIALNSIKQSNLLVDAINYFPEFQFKIIDETELNGIIDLLVETEEKYIIIDYKLNVIEKAEYVDQVMTYVNYIQSISNKKVEGYLLSLLSGSIKKVC